MIRIPDKDPRRSFTWRGKTATIWVSVEGISTTPESWAEAYLKYYRHPVDSDAVRFLIQETLKKFTLQLL